MSVMSQPLDAAPLTREAVQARLHSRKVDVWDVVFRWGMLLAWFRRAVAFALQLRRLDGCGWGSLPFLQHPLTRVGGSHPTSLLW